MTDARNFRSAYLERVGIKGVEEKKSLEILMKEQPLDLNKLSQFSLRFPLPAAYRPFIWKVILGILPPFSEAQEFVWRQRCEQYADLLEALTAMRRVDDTTCQAETHLKMFLIEQGMLPLDDQKVMADPSNAAFLAINKTLSELSEDPIEMYWLSTQFCRLNEKHKEQIGAMKDQVEHFLKREEQEELMKTKKSDPDESCLKFSSHLSRYKALGVLPLTHWFYCSFAGVLPNNSFERIWDKVVGGSCKILVFVAVAILITFKRPLMSMKSGEEMQRYLSKIPEDSGDIIVGKAIELWQKNGSLLLPSSSSRGASPSVTDRGHS